MLLALLQAFTQNTSWI